MAAKWPPPVGLYFLTLRLSHLSPDFFSKYLGYVKKAAIAFSVFLPFLMQSWNHFLRIYALIDAVTAINVYQRFYSVNQYTC